MIPHKEVEELAEEIRKINPDLGDDALTAHKLLAFGYVSAHKTLGSAASDELRQRHAFKILEALQ